MKRRWTEAEQEAMGPTVDLREDGDFDLDRWFDAFWRAETEALAYVERFRVTARQRDQYAAWLRAHDSKQSADMFLNVRLEVE